MNYFIFKYENILTAIGTAILKNIVVGIVLLILVQLIFSLFNHLKSAVKYKILYATLTLMFLSFVYTLVIDLQSQWIINNSHSQNVSTYINPNTTLPYPTFSLLYSYKSLLMIISVLYLVCLTFLSIKLLLQLWQIRTLKSGTSAPDNALQEIFKSVKLKIGLVQNVVLKLSNKISTPLMYGVIKPIILLPATLVTQIDFKQLELVLLHELAHIKRNDFLFNIIQSIIETILFFNPAMWLISSMVRKEREYACDDLVINNSNEPKLYANALLTLSTFQLSYNAQTMAMSGHKKSSLFNRIKRITMKENTKTNATKPILVLFSVLALSLSLVAVYGQKYNGKNNKSETQQEAETAHTSKENQTPDTENDYGNENTENEAESNITEDATDNYNNKPDEDVTFEPLDFEETNFDAMQFEALNLNDATDTFKKSLQQTLEELNNAIQILKETDWTLVEKELSEKLNKTLHDSTFNFSEDIKKSFEEAGKEIYAAQKELIKAESIIQNLQKTDATNKRNVVYYKHKATRDSITIARKRTIDSISSLREKQLYIAKEKREVAMQQRKRNEEYRKEAEAKRKEIEQKRKELHDIRVKYTQLGEINTEKTEAFLIKEGIVKRGRGYRLNYKDGKLYINNKVQSDAISKKAAPLFGAVKEYHYITNKSR